MNVVCISYIDIFPSLGVAAWVPTPDVGQPIPDPDSPCKNLWLFDIITDPLETQDLSTQMPEMVTMMLERLAFHDSTAAEAVNPPGDPAAYPSKNGFWRPWV